MTPFVVARAVAPVLLRISKLEGYQLGVGEEGDAAVLAIFPVHEVEPVHREVIAPVAGEPDAAMIHRLQDAFGRVFRAATAHAQARV